MTSHLHGGNHRPSFLKTTPATSRPISHNLVQTLGSTSRSVPQDIISEYNLGSFMSQDVREPPSKRQKLDTNRTIARSTLELQHTSNIPNNLLLQPVSAAVVDIPSLQADCSELLMSNSPAQFPHFPARPKELPSWTVRRTPLQSKLISKENVQSKPYQPETPSCAPYYEDNLPTDFFPWAGLHQEDILNEQSTKSGYFDRVQVSSNETNTARPSVWSSLKHKAGPQILSSLFASLLDTRQAFGTITAKCTFKPPPRVTLTDTKREAWLRDLANPLIPLRRLSRTIPHGIRGKSLLEQCLAKKIPTWRAVWLAKCVGANEIRASKRKGTSGAFSIGGESKWIRDWTLNVEQFMDMLVSSGGVSEWRNNIVYGLRLVVYIHAEHLIDSEHFFEWMVASIIASEPESLSAWFLIVEIYMNEICKFRFRGRRLAVALLEQLQKKCNIITTPDLQETSVSTLRRIANLVKLLAITEPALFVLPHCWLDYESALRLCLDEHDSNLNFCFEQIKARNLYLLGHSPTGLKGSEQTPRRRFIAVLDDMNLELDVGTLSDTACAIVNDPDLLVCTLIEWSATVYRQGVHRVYLALSLLRHWSIAGFDLDRPITQFISRFSTMAGLARLNVYKLIAELIRSRVLSISKHLQYLMAYRSDRSVADTNTGENFELDLLNHIPLYGLPLHVVNLRQTLLETYQLFDSEAQMKEAAIRMSISRKVSFLRSRAPFTEASFHLDGLECLSGTIKYGISRWIKMSIATELNISKSDGPNGLGKEPLTISMTVDDFRLIRNILEILEDYPTLADVLRMIVPTGHRDLSYLVAETVNYHIDIFLALGVAEGLFRMMLSCLKLFYARRPADKPILISFLDIGKRMSSMTHTLRPLHEELTLCDCKTPVAAYSPVSEHVVDALDPSDTTFVDGTELLFSSGSRMNRPTLSNIFASITKRLQLEALNNKNSLHDFMDLLAQLRTFDDESFDGLMLLWVEELFWSDHRSQIVVIIVHLVCADLLDLSCMLHKVSPCLRDDQDQDHRTRLALKILNILVARTSEFDFGNSLRIYRLHRSKLAVFRTCSDIVVLAIRHCLEGMYHQDQLVRQSVIDMTIKKEFLQLIQLLFLQHQPIMQELGGILCRKALRSTASTILNHLLGFPPSTGQLFVTDETEIKNLIHLANDFNIDICKLKLGLILSRCQDGSIDGKESYKKSVSILVQEAASGFHSHPGVWAGLLHSLPQIFVGSFREQSLSNLYTHMPDWPSDLATIFDVSAQQRNICEGLIAGIKIVESRTPKDESFGVIIELLRRLVTLLKSPQLARLETDRAKQNNLHIFSSVEDTGKLDGICQWIAILLRLLVIHQDILLDAKFPKQASCRLILSLAFLLVNLNTGRHVPSPHSIFDITALVSDSLSADNRLYCVMILCEQHSIRDFRLEYLLGPADQGQNESLLQVVGTCGISNSIAADFPSRTHFSLRRWEMVQDATPVIGENDTSLSLTLFGTRKAVL